MIENLTTYQQLLYIIMPLCILYGLFFYFRFKATPSISSKVLRPWAFIVFLFGVVLYAIGFNHGASSKSLLAMILRPLMSSLELFVSHSDFREVSKECRESTLYVTLFAWVQFNALFVSASFFFSLLGSRIISKVLDITEYVKFKKIDKLYVFWGLDDNAVLLANSVNDRMMKEKKEKGVLSKVVFVVLPSGETRFTGRMNFSRIFSSTNYDSSNLEKVSFIKNETILFANNKPHDTKCDFLKVKGVERLSKLIKRSNEIKIFFMSGDEKKNITHADMVVSSRTIRNKIKEDSDYAHNSNLKIYCQASRKAENLIHEKTLSRDHKIDISFIDSAYLAVLSMKVAQRYSKYVCPKLILDEHRNNRNRTKHYDNNDFINHPINYVNHTRGIVTSTFSSLIIGFGETGQYALDFLYEFGAFAGEGGKKSRFKCYIYDDNMPTLWTHYVQRVPLFRETLHNTREREVECYKYTPDSEQFWDDLKKRINTLNYIVICLGDDAKTMTVLGELYDEIIHNRKSGFDINGADELHICIRAYNKENEELIKKTIKAYNELAGGEVIRYFGMASKIYTIEKIDDEELYRLSEDIKKEYNEKQHNVTRDKHTSNFEKEYAFQRNRRKDYADKEQGLHLFTKSILLGDNPSEDIIENVAIGEHYRWCASLYIQGYLPMTEDQKKTIPDSRIKCSERLKRHACLKPYNSLTKEEKKLNRDYVMAALKLINSSKKEYNRIND